MSQAPASGGQASGPVGGSEGPRRWRRLLVRWGLRSLGLLILLLMAFLGVDFAAGFRSIGDAEVSLLVPAFGVFCLGVLGRMVTWVLVASALKIGYTRTVNLVRVFLVSWFAGLGIPRGAAAFTRLAVIAADRRSLGRGAVAVGVDRLAQVLGVVVLVVPGSIYVSTFSREAVGWLLVGCGVVIVVGMAFKVAVSSGLGRSLIRRVTSHRRLKSFSQDMAGVLHETARLRPSQLAGIGGSVIASSLLTLTALYMTSRALDIDIHFMTLMAAWGAVSLAGLFPISINGLGPREGILTAAVAGAGFNSEGGVALGLLWFFMQTATRLAAGLAWFTALRSRREETGDALQEHAQEENEGELTHLDLPTERG